VTTGGSKTSSGLSLWVYIGIILSLMWALGAGIHTHNADIKTAENFAKMVYITCTNKKLIDHNNDLSVCEQKRSESIVSWLKILDSTTNALSAALIPIPFGWLAGFILLSTIRAQIAGFRAVVQWPTLSKWKKAFVTFCVFSGLATVLFGVTVILNLYVDSKVPVSLFPSVDVIPTGEDFVIVNGTWTRTDLVDDSIANPLQSSHIECNRQERKCIEAVAAVDGNVLLAPELKNYEIVSWTPASIVFKNEDTCSRELFTIDLNTHTVSGAGRLINQNSTFCKLNFKSKEEWTFALSSGFKIYWDLRQKARPYPLRVIHSLFGN
jgi:hypothetical protein